MYTKAHLVQDLIDENKKDTLGQCETYSVELLGISTFG